MGSNLLIMETYDAIVKISQGTSPAFESDKRKNFPLVLTCLGGTMPVNLNKKGEPSSIGLVNGTSAILKGLKAGTTALVQFTKSPNRTYTRLDGVEVTAEEYDCTLQMEITSPLELLQAKGFVGAPKRIVLAAPVPVEAEVEKEVEKEAEKEPVVDGMN